MVIGWSRPINVPCRWNSGDDEDDKVEAEAEAEARQDEGEGMENENSNEFSRSSYYYGFSGRVSSPETIISLERSSFPTIKVCLDDLQLINSPSSPAASSLLCQEEQVIDDDVASSYVIEINPDYRDGTGEAVSIDEAIAWAKERFHQQPNQVSNGMLLLLFQISNNNFLINYIALVLSLLLYMQKGLRLMNC